MNTEVPRATRWLRVSTVFRCMRATAFSWTSSCGFHPIGAAMANGGSVQNRCRLLLEVVSVASEVWGSGRVGVWLSPANPTNYRLADSDPALLLQTALAMLSDLRIAYADVVEGSTTAEPPTHVLDYPSIRRAFNGSYVANNGPLQTHA